MYFGLLCHKQTAQPVNKDTVKDLHLITVNLVHTVLSKPWTDFLGGAPPKYLYPQKNHTPHPHKKLGCARRHLLQLVRQRFAPCHSPPP